MAILVSGGAGYIGSHMVLNLVDNNEEVVVIDNLSTGFEWAVDKRATLIKGDIGNIELVSQIINKYDIEEIIHFAGSIIVPESVENPLKYYQNNSCVTRNLLEAAVNNKVKHFIFSSTAAVYGMVGNEPVNEETILNPISPYGRSKLMSEIMLKDISAAHPLSFGILRYFNVAGADKDKRSGQSTPNATHLIKVATQTALGKRKFIEIFGTDFDTPDGTCLRDYIHVSDLVEAHSLLVQYLRAGGESTILNCGYGSGYSVREVINEVKRVTNIDFSVREAARRAGDPAVIIANGEKLRSLLGWQPKYDDLEIIVKSAFEWEKYLQNKLAKEKNGVHTISD